MHVEEIIEHIYIYIYIYTDHFTTNPKYVTFPKALFRDDVYF